MKKNLLIYTLLIGFFAVLIWFVIDAGKTLTPASQNQLITNNLSISKPNVSAIAPKDETIWLQYLHNIKSPLGILLLQIIVILSVSKLFGSLIGKIRQPSVIGEMLAGIFLGPSIVGLIFPEFSGFIFPAASLGNLQFLSQIGLVFFMFIIGMELDLDKLKGKAQNALVISHASIIFPYFLGVMVSYFLYEEFAPANVSFLAFSLFMGIAVSITAFPVLARILQERGLTQTPLGIITIACAAFDDVTAWCILAVVIAIVKAGSIVSALLTVILALIFVLVMFYLIKPFIRKAGKEYSGTDALSKTTVVMSFLVLLLSAYTTEVIGIHALFGAFLAGVIMPRDTGVKEKLMEKLEDVSISFLLPLFFAFTGLRTQIGLLNEGYLWAACALIIFVAVLGKFGGSAFAAKLTGQTWKDSFSIGALMNTRGLMELIVLNIGYDLGILSPSLFAIMVIMALVTTFMTGPLLDCINYFSNKNSASANNHV
ncbi:MAG: cation:proton antiporter [Chitinophagaceae bacterium]|jgi:Kef-type K+ transport system membrane component KefB